jgi:hypothetical protein
VTANSEHAGRELWRLLGIAVLFAAFMWLITTRTMPGMPTAPPAGWTFVPARARLKRLLLLQLGYAAFIALLSFGGSPPVAIALGAGLWGLATAGSLRRWERRTGRQLLSDSRWSAQREFYAR